MRALVFERREARFVAAHVAGRLRPGAGARVGPLSLQEVEPPTVPGAGWTTVTPRLSGICGSDLATIDGRSSRYFEPIVSFPFVPGHEVVGIDEAGRRVVVEPVLGHTAHGHVPPSPGAAPADGDDLGHLLGGGTLPAGLQIGYCASTGGGWSGALVAPDAQLHPVRDDLADEAAVMVEPTACAVHAALRARVEPGDLTVVIGAGTMGLCTVAALRSLTSAGTIVAAARYPHQRRLAGELGADVVVDAAGVRRAVRRAAGCRVVGDVLSGGADVVIDAVGSESSLADAIAVCRPRGRVVVLGMPARVSLDLTPLWHRETELVGTYAYGTEQLAGGATAHTFDLAADLVAEAGLGRLVTATYPLDDYVEAVGHAAEAGRRGAVKIAFDLRG